MKNIIGLLLIAIVIILIIGIIVGNNENKKNEIFMKEFVKDNNISDTYKYILLLESNYNQLKDNNSYSKGISNLIWIQNEKLNLCKSPHYQNNSNFTDYLSIPLKNVVFYGLEGDYRIQQIIEGGGLNLAGAIVGGVLAGGVGAILGGRKKVKTTEKEIDERKTYLYYTENNITKELVFNKEGYDKLKVLIPHKDIEVIEREKKIKNIQNDF